MSKQKVESRLTMNQVSDILQVSHRTLQRWIDAGLIEAEELPTGSFGNPAVRFSASAINDALTTKRPRLDIELNELQNKIYEITVTMPDLEQATKYYEQRDQEAIDLAKMILGENVSPKCAKAAKAILDGVSNQMPDRHKISIADTLKIIHDKLKAAAVCSSLPIRPGPSPRPSR